MQMLSTGDPSTLGNWRNLVNAAFGPGPALTYLDKKIEESPNKENEEVIAAEPQFLYLLVSLNTGHSHGQ